MMKRWYNNNTVLCLILQESLATVEGSREQTQRCFTLEAIDTILFCSSIAYDIAYRAATIGLEHEQQSELASALRPTVSMVGQSIPRSDGSLKPPHTRTSRHRKQSQKLSRWKWSLKIMYLCGQFLNFDVRQHEGSKGRIKSSGFSLCRVCNVSSSQSELQANGHIVQNHTRSIIAKWNNSPNYRFRHQNNNC